jgi:hypothetical protein
LSASSRILAARIAATPSPLPTDYVSAPAPGTLPTAAATVYPLPHYVPYIGPIGAEKGHGRGPLAARTVEPAAAAAATPAPTYPPAVVFKNPYSEPLELADIAAQQAHAVNRIAALEALKAN